MSLKKNLNQLLSHLPNHGEMIKNIYRRLRYEKRKLTLKYKMIFKEFRITNPDKIYWIDPNLIMYHTNYIKGSNVHFKDRIFDKIKDKGRIYSGDWDLSPHKFTDLDVFKAFEQRILYGKKWEETKFFKYELATIEAGQVKWGCRNLNDWKERCRYLDSLIQSIGEKGYLLGHNLTSSQGSLGAFLRPEMSEEITVNIGRNGQYLFQGGRHRLAIVKILGLKQIPVKVLVRHKKWQELKEQLLSMTKQNRGATAHSGILYQPAIHPDLSDIPAGHLSEDRFLAIKRSLKYTTGIVLDIGANLAFFCHKFENLGFECYAIENDLEISDAANRIRIAAGKKFTIFEGNLSPSRIIQELQFYLDESINISTDLVIFDEIALNNRT